MCSLAARIPPGSARDILFPRKWIDLAVANMQNNTVAIVAIPAAQAAASTVRERSTKIVTAVENGLFGCVA